MHCYMWFVGLWVGAEVSKPQADECSWDYLPTILVTTKLWVHLYGPFGLDQTPLLYFQKVGTNGKWVS